MKAPATSRIQVDTLIPPQMLLHSHIIPNFSQVMLAVVQTKSGSGLFIQVLEKIKHFCMKLV